jgi:DNA-binding transcriptional ArsR family regulator
MMELDPHVHQPTRLRILMLLSGVEAADFNFFLGTLGLTKGNLSSHMSRLEEAGYVRVVKSFSGKIPNTSYSLTREGRTSLERYWRAIDDIRLSAPREGERRAPSPSPARGSAAAAAEAVDGGVGD